MYFFQQPKRRNKKPSTSYTLRKLTLQQIKNLTAFTIVLFLVLTGLCNCRSTKINPDSTKDLEYVAVRELGNENLIELNATKTYALCQQKRQEDHVRRKIKYMVIRISDYAVVHEGIFSMGYVRWLDNNAIEILSESGNGKDGDSIKKIIYVDSPYK